MTKDTATIWRTSGPISISLRSRISIQNCIASVTVDPTNFRSRLSFLRVRHQTAAMKFLKLTSLGEYTQFVVAGAPQDEFRINGKARDSRDPQVQPALPVTVSVLAKLGGSGIRSFGAYDLHGVGFRSPARCAGHRCHLPQGNRLHGRSALQETL